jgi:hypothetical protein
MTINQAASVYIVIVGDVSSAVLSLQLCHHTMVHANHCMTLHNKRHLIFCRFQTVEQTVMDDTHLFAQRLNLLVDTTTNQSPCTIAHGINACKKPQLPQYIVHKMNGHVHIQLEAGRME